MTSLAERRLAEFVDREGEMALFLDMLAQRGKAVLCLWGDAGIGKSSLLARMTHECAQRGMLKAEVTWTDTRPHDYLAVMRKIRDDILSSLGPGPQPSPPVSPFAPFNDLANYFTVDRYELTIKLEGAPNVSVANQAVFEGATTRDIVGIQIKDTMLTLPRTDKAVPAAERMARLTDRFLADLAAVVARSPLVVFLDAVEKMSPDTTSWIWGELLEAMRTGKLGNAVFVLCGQCEPVLDREWEFFVEMAKLHPLEHGHVVEYLARRGVEESIRAALATMVLANTGGRVGEVAKMVDSFLKLAERQARGSGRHDRQV